MVKESMRGRDEKTWQDVSFEENEVNKYVKVKELDTAASDVFGWWGTFCSPEKSSWILDKDGFTKNYPFAQKKGKYPSEV